MPAHRTRPTGPRRLALAAVVLATVLAVGAAACKPHAAPPGNWVYHSVYQAHSSATFGVHHKVRYRYNGRRIEVLSNTCAADDWYSGLRYTGRCTATPKNGRLEVEWEWIWAKGAPPMARSQTYGCRYRVSLHGTVTRGRTGLLELPCNRFDP